MYNCYKLFRNGHLFAVVHTETAADRLIHLYKAFYELKEPDYVLTYEPAFIEGIGF